MILRTDVDLSAYFIVLLLIFLHITYLKYFEDASKAKSELFVNIVYQNHSRNGEGTEFRGRGRFKRVANAIVRNRQKDRVSNGDVGRKIATENRMEYRRGSPFSWSGGRPYGGLPQQIGPIVITLESSPASAPSRRRK